MWPILLVMAGLAVMIFSAVDRGMKPTVDEPAEGEPMGNAEKSWLGLVVRAAATGVTALVLLGLWTLSMYGHFRLAVVLALVAGFGLSYYSRDPVDR